MNQSGAQRVSDRLPASASEDGHTAHKTFESPREAFIRIDAEGSVVGWTHAAEHTLGWSAAEADGQPMAELIVPERFREAHHGGLLRYRETGKSRVSGHPLSLHALNRDGHELEIELIVSAMQVGAATVFNASRSTSPIGA